MRVAVVVGNPKPASTTLRAATLLADEIAGAAPEVVIDVATLGAGLIGFGDDNVVNAIDTVRGCDLVIVGSPTYKATYTGILKVFLDQVPADGLAGIVAVPLMLGAGPAHAMAPDLLLKPVLVELGATCPTRGLYLGDKVATDPASFAGWLPAARVQIEAAVAGHANRAEQASGS